MVQPKSWGAANAGGAPRLTIHETGATVLLGAAPCVVGRLQSCGLTLEGEAESSRKHFEVGKSGSRWVAKDLGSRNGTKLNGTRLEGSFPLFHADVLSVGKTDVLFECAPEPLPPGTRVGNCELLSAIGRTRWGTLYAGKQGSLEREVEVEVVDPDLAADPRFRAEHEARAQLAGAFDHPRIRAVFDTSSGGEHLYTVLEACRGSTSVEALLEQKRLDKSANLELLEELCRVLEHVHGKGRHHGCLTSEVVLRDGDGRVKLTGLGRQVRLGKHLPEADLQATYASPEEAKGQPSGPPSDMYSLGVLAYRMFVGRAPYEGRSKELLAQHASSTEVPLPPSLETRLAATLGRLLAKDPIERPSATEAIGLFEVLRGVKPGKGVKAGSARGKKASARDKAGSARSKKGSSTRTKKNSSARTKKESGRALSSSSDRAAARGSSGRSATLAKRASGGRVEVGPPDPLAVVALRLLLIGFGYLAVVVAASALTRIVLRAVDP